jgi:hypothetical protein
MSKHQSKLTHAKTVCPGCAKHGRPIKRGKRNLPAFGGGTVSSALAHDEGNGYFSVCYAQMIWLN